MGPALAISDAVHSGGTEGFYFLPPLVPAPPFDGVFDTTLSPTVLICVLAGPGCGVETARFTTETGPGSETVRLVSEDEQYLVNWHTDEFGLDPDQTYRILVLVAGSELGFADVDVVSGGNELKNVETGEFIPLKDGRTLPISFRIEQGAVFVVGEDGGTISSENGRVEMTVPTGSLPSGEQLGVTVEPVSAAEVPQDAGLIPGAVYEFGPDGTEFLEPVELTISYDEANIPSGLSESDLTLLTEGEDGLWVEIAGSVVDEAANRVTGWITGFSGKAVGAEVAAISQPPDVVLFPGDTVQLSFVVVDASGQRVQRGVSVWSSDPSIATTYSYRVIGVAPGQTTVLIEAGGEQVSVGVTVAPEASLPRIEALLGDPVVGHLLAGASDATRSTLEGSLTLCVQAIEAGDGSALAQCLTLTRTQSAEATDPTDRALLAVLDLVLAFAQGVLGS